MAAMEATWWLNEQLQAWLGEKNAADTLTQSVPDNVTSEMGLALLDVADVIRPHPDVVAFLQHVEDEDFLDELPRLAGGREARDAIRGLARQVRHALRRRDRHHAAALERAPHHARADDPRQRQELRAGRRRAALRARAAGGLGRRSRSCWSACGRLPDGEREGRRDQADDRPRPDLHRLSRVSEVRHGQPLLRLQAGAAGRSRAPRAGRRAARAGRHLLPHASRSSTTSCARTGWTTSSSAERKDAFRSYQALTPPRVLTSDGEVVAGTYRRDDLPAGALVGLRGLRRDRRGARPRHPRHGGGRPRAGRHPGHRLHGSRAGRRCSSRSRAW